MQNITGRRWPSTTSPPTPGTSRGIACLWHWRESAPTATWLCGSRPARRRPSGCGAETLGGGAHSAGRTSRLLRVENTFYAPLAIAAAYRSHYSLLTVGVTGSVGKTTTKDFIAAVLSARYKTLKSQGQRQQ